MRMQTMASSFAHQEFGKTRAEWLSNLNTEYKPANNFRRTSIICTIGMSSNKRIPHGRTFRAMARLTSPSS